MLACLWLACGLFPSILAIRRDNQKGSVIVALDAQSAVENITLFPNHLEYVPVPVIAKAWPPALLLEDFGNKEGILRSALSETGRYMGLWKIQAESIITDNEWDAWYLPKCFVSPSPVTEVNLVKEKRWAGNEGCAKESRHKVCPTGYSEVCKQTEENGQTKNSMCCCPQEHLWYKKKRGRGFESHPRQCQDESTSGKPEPGSQDGESFILQSLAGSEEALESLENKIKTDFAISQHHATTVTMLARTSAATCGQGLVQHFVLYFFKDTGYNILNHYRTDDFHAATRASCSIDIAPTSQEIVVTNRAIWCNTYDKKKCVKLCLITKLPDDIKTFESVKGIASMWQLAIAGENEKLDVQTAFQDEAIWKGAYKRCAN